MTRKISIIALAFCLTVFWGSAARPQPVKLASSGHGKRVSLTVNYQKVATLGARGGASASDRVNVALSRLAGLAKSGAAPHFTSGRASGGWAVLTNGGVVMLAVQGDARAAKVKRRALARRWAASLERAWNTPLLRLADHSIVVAAGATRALRVSGVGRGPIRLTVTYPAVATARINGGALSVRGLSPGRGAVSVWRDGATETVNYRVMKWAGSVRGVTLEVTGSAVPREIIQSLVQSETYRGIRLEPGAFSVVQSPPVLPTMWTMGSTYRTSLGIRIAGPGYLPVETRLPLVVVRRRLPSEKRMELFYSNKPETVEAAQVLFRHAVDGGTPARLLYHHQNTSERPLLLGVDLRNAGDKPVRVQVVDGSADACVDTVFAGHQAAYKFLKRLSSGAGLIVELPPHSIRRISSRLMRAGETASGIMMVRPLGSQPLTLSTVAESPGGQAVGEGARRDADTVFPSPDQIVDASYTVGGAWTYVPIGQTPISSVSGVRLDGNYGVLYTCRLRMENPTASHRTVQVLFEPRAGEARAAMLINGALSETPRAIPPEEIRVASVRLAPHQVKTLTLITIPAGGGSYPAALIIHG